MVTTQESPLAAGAALEYEWKDLDSEEFRVYRFPDGLVVKITAPLKIAVSSSGGHRVLDSQGISHYIPAGWVHLQWKVKPGCPHFDF